MKFFTAIICTAFTSVTVKDRKETLSVNSIEGSNKRMRVFHIISSALNTSDCTCITEMLWQMWGWSLQGNLIRQRGAEERAGSGDHAPFGRRRTGKPQRCWWGVGGLLWVWVATLGEVFGKGETVWGKVIRERIERDRHRRRRRRTLTKKRVRWCEELETFGARVLYRLLTLCIDPL